MCLWQTTKINVIFKNSKTQKYPFFIIFLSFYLVKLNLNQNTVFIKMAFLFFHKPTCFWVQNCDFFKTFFVKRPKARAKFGSTNCEFETTIYLLHSFKKNVVFRHNTT